MIMNKRRAFTLVELLIALSITVLIGGTVVAMIMSVSQGTSDTQDGRRYFVRGQMLQNRLREVIQRSHCVLAVSSTAIVLWFDDIPGPDGTFNSNGDPVTPPTYLGDRYLVNRNEIALIEWDSVSQQVRMYYSPDTPIESMPTSASTPGAAYPSNWNSATFMAEAQKIKGQSTGLSQMEVLGTQVTAFNINVYPSAEPLSDASVVNATATIGSNLGTRNVVIGARMRQKVAPK